MINKAYFNTFKQLSFSLYSYPINVRLFDLKMNLKEFIILMNKKGLKYDYELLKVVLRGKANNSFNIHYFTHIYEALNLPLPTPEYLYDSFTRWEEIKAFKLERRNTNRIKKGLLPVTSISTRIK
jgi:hypothetical protein